MLRSGIIRGWPHAVRVAALLLALTLCALAAQAETLPPISAEPAKPIFKEVWAYLLRGEEKELTGTEPITDLCYFGASVARNGRITETVSRPAIVLKDGVKPAIHLVIDELSNDALMHFSLDPAYGVRPLLIEDICRVGESFDGIQIDFESIARDDADFFFGFMKDLRARLPASKRLSIAVPARTELIADAYDYTRIAPLVDRMIIMAYDEHWSASSPGPIASLPWCAKVVDYAKGAVGVEKIVMGLPLYGRAWQDRRLAKALRFKKVLDLVAETKSTTSYAPELGASFEYSENVVVTVFFDDHRSLMEKLRLYQSREVKAVSFWRLGQGPPLLWDSIGNSSGTAPAGRDPASSDEAPPAAR